MSMRKLSATLCLLSLLFVVAAVAAAQSDAIHAGVASAPKIATSVPGVTVFSGPPAGFNPLTASTEDLARYGFPRQPNQQNDPIGYRQWVRTVTSMKTRATDVRAEKWHSSPADRLTLLHTTGVSNAPSGATSSNWSGVANTNKLTKWNANTSFNYIQSAISVPFAQPPFGGCGGGAEGNGFPWVTSLWNGVDGITAADVIQGGIALTSVCDGGTGWSDSYVAWVEWYPSYPQLTIYCGGNPCAVSPGDTVFVETMASEGTAEQTVCVYETSQNWSGCFGLDYVTGSGVIGSSEEQIVETPCCYNDGFYPMNNYNYGYFADAYGEDAKGTVFYVGEQTSATYLITLLGPGSDGALSGPIEQGSTGTAGKFMLWMSDEGCAYDFSSGCTY